MKFLCDAERCIECNGCVTACKNEHEIPWGVNRRRVVTLNDGVPGEKSISVACMHCSDAPCMAVCPVDCFYKDSEGVVLHDKDCVSAAAIASTRARSVRRSFPRMARSACAARWTSARSARRSRGRQFGAEYKKYGAIASRGKLPACAEMCSTKACSAAMRTSSRTFTVIAC
jgi:formate dehydrogenase iron-sulfur subunit